MLSRSVNIQTVIERKKWNWAVYSPDYEHTLSLVRGARWNSTRLGDLAEFFKYGASLSPDYKESGLLFVRAQNIREHGIDLTDVRYIDPDTPSIHNYCAQAGDILITRSGINVGDAAAISDELAGSTHGSYSIRLRLKRDPDVSPNYLAIVLNTSLVKNQVAASKGRSAQPNINIKELSALLIPLPPRLVQDRIAQVMQGAYAARREKLAEADRLYRETSDFALKELGVSVQENPSHRRVFVPVSAMAGRRFDFEAVVSARDISFDGMEAVLLREVVHQVNERITPAEDCPDEDVNYISLGNIAGNTGELAEFSSIKGASVLSSSPRFRQGDILFGRMRPYLNKVWIAEFDGVCTGEAIVLRPDTTKVDTRFLHALLLSRITLQQVVPLQSGTSLPRVSASDILNVKLPIPRDLKRQTEVAGEISRRRMEAKRLRAEAEAVVAEAKARVERMILGEET